MMPTPTPCNSQYSPATTPCVSSYSSPQERYFTFPTPAGSVDVIEKVSKRSLSELEVIKKVLASLDRQEKTALYYQEKTQAHAYALCIAALENLLRDMGDGES